MRCDTVLTLRGIGTLGFLLALAGCFDFSSIDPPDDAECEADNDCSGDRVCARGACAARCDNVSACGDDEACLDGGCVVYVDVPCAAGSPCADGVARGDGQACEPAGSGLDDGEPCSAANACASGFCVDGVCCDTECAGECRSCLAAQSEGVDGVCTFVPAGSEVVSNDEPPAEDCPGVQTCDGEGACFAKAPGGVCDGDNECLSGFCTDGVCCEERCGGTCQRGSEQGSCVAVTSGEDPGTCASCISDGSCDGRDIGEGCSAATECGSNSCVDEVCCSSACDGVCQSCSSGACESVLGVADPDTCAQCTAAGECAAPAGEGCVVDTDCLSGVCECGLCREWRVLASPTGATLRDAIGTSRTEIFAVGDGGTILRFNGESWSQESVPTTEDLVDIDVRDSTYLVGGNNGTVLRKSGSGAWTVLDAGVSDDVKHVRVVDASEYWLNANSFVRFSGGSWSTIGFMNDEPPEVSGGCFGTSDAIFSVDGRIVASYIGPTGGILQCTGFTGFFNGVNFDPQTESDTGTYRDFIRLAGRDLAVASDATFEFDSKALFVERYEVASRRPVSQSGSNAFFVSSDGGSYRVGPYPLSDLETVQFPVSGVQAIGSINGCAEVAVGEGGLLLRY